MKIKSFILIVLMILLCGCSGKKGQPVPDERETSEVPYVTENGTEEQDTDSKEFYELYQDGRYNNEYMDVSLFARINSPDEAGMDNPIILETADVGNIVVVYEIEKNADEFETHVAVLDRDTFKIKKDTIVGKSMEWFFITRSGVFFSNISKPEKKILRVIPDTGEKNEIEFNAPSDGTISDGGKYYFIENGSLFMVDLNSTEGKIVPLITNPDFLPLYICSTDSRDDKEYVEVEGYGRDFKLYRGLIDVKTGNFVVLYQKEYGTYLLETVTDDKKITYQYADRENTVYNIKLNNKERLFVELEENKIRVSLFDENKACIIATTKIESPFKNGETFWLSPAIQPFYKDENSILISFSSNTNETCVYCWKPEGIKESRDELQICSEDFGENKVAGIAPLYELSDFRGGSNPENFSGIIKKAEEISKKYDITISLGKECASIFGGYAVASCMDVEIVQKALDVLDAELAKYPKGFLARIKNNINSRFDFYLAGELVGVEENSLYNAIGFQIAYSDEIRIVADCRNEDVLRRTIHHEISHCIDDFLSAQSAIDENKWHQLNSFIGGCTDVYSKDYNIFGYEEFYGFCLYPNMNKENAYFIDYYSMTFQEEDRARIWEYMMAPAEDFTWDEVPHLKQKLLYYLDCIRLVVEKENLEGAYWDRITE